ncbi:hypothetical protein ACP6PL_08500 [Dapis sp. BLCC M126]|uniref:hypothetical protein n=1 Tax=Dapis sp. BLCC M126 TaxID=3400189 RepID=UPI003CF236CC
MSNMKYNAIVNSGIQIVERVPIPDELLSEDAQVEIAAKKAAGYYTDGVVPDENVLSTIKGRNLTD